MAKRLEQLAEENNEVRGLLLFVVELGRCLRLASLG
jgi:hypothetical protein